MDLFDYMRESVQETESPLAARLRPKHKRINKKARANIERGDLCHED